MVAAGGGAPRTDSTCSMISTNWGVATDTGLVRPDNQDSLLAQMPIFVVADGMGGHAAGAVASRLAVGEFQAIASTGVQPTVEAIARAIDSANERIAAEALARSVSEGMGTTIVGLALVTDRDQELWLVFNVGDSRLYRLWEGTLTQVTIDHSEVQELVETGAITAEAARVHPNRNIITRAVGIDRHPAPDFWLRPPEPGERFLLTSDGLTEEVLDNDILCTLDNEPDPSVAATRLVEQAIAAGGHDNVTVVIVDVVAPSEGPDTVDTARNPRAPIATEFLEPSGGPGGTDKGPRL